MNKNQSYTGIKENRGYYKPGETQNIPDEPGVYLMKDSSGKVIYVGKAKNLKRRVSQYFQKSREDGNLKTRLLVEHITIIDIITVTSEAEALILEANLIKQYMPRYNVLLKDNKFYPFVRVTVHEKFPRIVFSREDRRDGSKYFGPYTSAWAVRQYIDVVQRAFKIRTCFEMPAKECLNYHIKRCCGPCIHKVTQEEYAERVKEALELLSGDTEDLIKTLDKKMRESSSQLQFEKAQLFKERLDAVKMFEDTQSVFLSSKISADFIGFLEKSGKVLFVVTIIRNGKMIGKRSYTASLQVEEEMEDVLRIFIPEYLRQSDQKQELIVLGEDGASILPELNGFLLKEYPGKTASLPADDKQKQLVRMAEENAALHLSQVLSKVERSESLKLLQEILKLDTLPMRIEGFDIANIMGENAVASMVSFYAGKPDNKNYRHFKIKSKDTPDDFAMIHEAVYRRYKRLSEEDASLPDLILIDGGKGQLNAALQAISEVGISLNVISLAKKNEEIYHPYSDKPIVLERNSPALQVLQHVRDETHRFANTFYNKLKGKSLMESAFDGIPGIGEKRKQIILKKFMNYDIINSLTEEDLKREGIPEESISAVLSKIRSMSAGLK